MMAERLKISKADSNNFSAGPRREELHGLRLQVLNGDALFGLASPERRCP